MIGGGGGGVCWEKRAGYRYCEGADGDKVVGKVTRTSIIL